MEVRSFTGEVKTHLRCVRSAVLPVEEGINGITGGARSIPAGNVMHFLSERLS